MTVELHPRETASQSGFMQGAKTVIKAMSLSLSDADRRKLTEWLQRLPTDGFDIPAPEIGRAAY